MIPVLANWLKPTIVFVACGSLLWMTAALAKPEADVLAQSATNTPRPTPTNIGGDSDEDGDQSGAVIPGQNAGVSGIVYNFSDNTSPSPGIVVIIEGGGWSQETVTDSNGRYFFAGLGMGSAVLNLRLPEGAHPAAPNWPIFTDGETGVDIDLGYFWGETRPLPVVLRGAVAPTAAPVGDPVTLSYEIENFTSETAANGLLDIQLPPELQAVEANASQGVVDLSSKRVRLSLGDLPPGSLATLQIQTSLVAMAADGGRIGQPVAFDATGPAAVIFAGFTYDQMIVPQSLQTAIVTLEGQLPPQPAQETGQTVEAQVAPAQATADLPTTGGQPSPEPAAPSSGQTQAETAPTATSAADAPPSSAGAEGPETDTGSLIPATGQAQTPSSTPAIWVSIFLVLGLGAAGVTALRSRGLER